MTRISATSAEVCGFVGSMSLDGVPRPLLPIIRTEDGSLFVADREPAPIPQPSDAESLCQMGVITLFEPGVTYHDGAVLYLIEDPAPIAGTVVAARSGGDAQQLHLIYQEP